MNSISPVYYAAGDMSGDYELIGSGFDRIPGDAVGVWSRYNDRPLEYRYTDISYRLFSISEKTNNRMILSPKQSVTVGEDIYLGGIVSADRSMVIWVNNTKPLP